MSICDIYLSLSDPTYLDAVGMQPSNFLFVELII